MGECHFEFSTCMMRSKNGYGYSSASQFHSSQCDQSILNPSLRLCKRFGMALVVERDPIFGDSGYSDLHRADQNYTLFVLSHAKISVVTTAYSLPNGSGFKLFEWVFYVLKQSTLSSDPPNVSNRCM